MARQDGTRARSCHPRRESVGRLGFHELALARLWLQIEPENVASQRVAERCGFVREGRLRSHFEGRYGGRVDVLIYGLLPGELNEAA
jgi:RimJ/RimL family protein N-acetyltransferase